MIAALVLAAEGGGRGGGTAGLLVVAVVVGVLGWVVARSLQRQRDYERRLRDRPDGIHGGRPDDEAESGADDR